MNFRWLQSEVKNWHERHFPNVDTTRIVLKTVEEVGELARARERQLARGERLTREEADAIGDITICLAALCAREGWDYQEIVEQTWAEVEARDMMRVIDGSQTR